MNMKSMKLMAAVLAAAVAGPVLADTYDIDAAHTTFGFGVKHMVVATVKGHFTDFKGEFEYDAAKPESFKSSTTIEVKSITTANQKRDDHLRSADFFDAEKFPKLTFVGEGLDKATEGYTLRGKLTIKDTTKDVFFPVSVNGPIQDPWGNQRIGIEGTLKINRKDYGLKFDGKLANGDLVVGDQVTIEIATEGIKRK
jgi:polyisoprenoid-binding protein YceI